MGAAVRHLLSCTYTLFELPVHPHIPYPSAFFSPFYFSCMTHKLGSQPLPQIPKTEFQHHAALGSTSPPHGSAWTITSLLSYPTHSTIFSFITRTQQCCGVLSQQLRGWHRKHSSSLPGSSVMQELEGNALAPAMLFCLMLCGAVASSDWLSLPLRLGKEIKGLWGHGSL